LTFRTINVTFFINVIQNCIVEEARWYHDDEDEEAYERVIVKTYRPNMISDSVEFDGLLEECKRINRLKHRCHFMKKLLLATHVQLSMLAGLTSR